MAAIIHFPDFMINNMDLKPGKIRKCFYFFYGIIVGIIHKNTNGKLFCFFMNLFFNKENKIFFEEGLYCKKIQNEKICYPNKRIDRIIIDYKKHLSHFLESYCLDDFEIQDNDTVLDCGANVGELYFALKQNKYNFEYIAFEPDPVTYNCLKKNIKNTTSKTYKGALSEKSGFAKFFIDSEGGDSSLVFFGKDTTINVKTYSLDSLKLERVKLFKVEAEGYEYEVLCGAKNTLSKIQYITVDYGPEKGIAKETSKADVTNFLYENGFTMIKGSKFRHIALFKNINF